MPAPLNNQLLQAAEQQVEAKLTPENRSDYLKIVVAGMRAAGHGGPNGLLAGLRRRQDPIADCAIGAVNLVLLMSKQSKGMMPVRAMVPAAMTLMLQALDLVDKAGIAKVDANELGRATHVFTNHLFKSLGISMPMLQNAAQRVHGVMTDPAKMEAIKRRVGASQDPRAGTPTPLPAGGTNGV